MSCKFYTFKDGDYHCLKSGRDVDDDVYYSYCRGYSYDECPIYKDDSSSSGSSGCYLTSACIRAKNLPDDCYELTVLRDFRDNYLKNLPNGSIEIAEYYATAPHIVKAINKLPNAEEIWDGLFNELIQPCVKWIENGSEEKAHKLYREVSRTLAREYKVKIHME